MGFFASVRCECDGGRKKCVLKNICMLMHGALKTKLTIIIIIKMSIFLDIRGVYARRDQGYTKMAQWKIVRQKFSCKDAVSVLS